MTTTTQPNPNPLPAILVYGTPTSAALTQASWFRAEDKEAVKAAAEALKFSVIELQTDADKALATGVHEGVLKGSGRMIVGSVSAEVYRRIEEHVRKGASASDPSKPDSTASERRNPRQNKPRTTRDGRAATNPLGNPGCAGDHHAGQAPRERPFGSARGSLPPTGTRSGNLRGSGSRPSSGSSPASSPSSGSTRQNIRRSRAGPRTSPFRIPSSASRASDARKSVLRKLTGAAFGSPLFIPAHARKPGARPSNPQPHETKAMTSTTVSTAERIRALNDAFRRTFVGGLVMITAGVEAMPVDQRRSLLAKVRAFDVFTDDNDPHGEHDFGAVDEGGVRCFWKIDYYDRATEMGSPDPADPAVTTRVLTIMRADEY